MLRFVRDLLEVPDIVELWFEIISFGSFAIFDNLL